MGVSIIMQIGRKEIDITPGWRSMMHTLLLREHLLGMLSAADIPALEKLAKEQFKGEQEPPFDWSQDIHNTFQKIIDAINKHGSVIIETIL